jgi:prepilin-type N-terminal cleavage/methylation domain-containing protein
MSRTSQNKGFTLLELVFAAAIAVILLGMTAVSMRPVIDQEGPRGLAHSLAADLRAARAEAMRSGRPVAFCFASDSRTNSLTRAAHVRVGEQKGKLWRTLSYESEYDATIFLGKWGDAVSERFNIPDGWRASTSRETALYFAPDGRAYSEDLLSLDGRYPLVVASAMEGTFNGAEGTLSGVVNPQTIWVSQRGTIEVKTDQTPLGTLPRTGSKDLTVARLGDEPAGSGAAPTIVSSTFLPGQVDGLETAGIGQNFVQIHPNQKDGQQLEYGLATIEVRAEDADGGPLRYVLAATTSTGDAGKFSVSEQQGELSFLYDEVARRHLWKTVVSWRPPPSAPANRTYQLFLTVYDPEGHSVEVSTEAGLLPAVTSLPPARIVVCSTGQQMYLTNLDGANEVRITRDGPEYSPFFSQDGSCIFSFHDLDAAAGHRELRSRPANGSIGYARLADFQGATSNILYDPTYTFAALLSPAGTHNFDWGQVTESSGGGGGEEDGGGGTEYNFSNGSNSVPVSNVFILNLMSSDPPVRVTSMGTGEFFWAANARHTFFFGEEVPLPEITEHGYGPFSPNPGHEEIRLAKYLVGFPPTLVDSEVEAVSAAGRVYNPAHQGWYLVVDGNRLSAHNQSTGVSQLLYTAPGGFERSDSGRPNPSWSADGERVAFIASPGPSARVISLRVLDSDFSLLSSPEVDFELAVADASRAQLSPAGEWIYFLRGGNVMRAVNQTGSPLVDITDHLEIDVADYVISP